MKIEIKNDRDLDNFYRKLKFIKYFKNTSIIVKYDMNSKDKKEIDAVITLIKLKRNERLSFIYDYICDFIDENYINKNFCEFCNNKCLEERALNKKESNGCCMNCHKLKNGECSIKSIGCKLFFCPSIRHEKKVFEFSDIRFLNSFLTIKDKFIFSSDLFKEKEEVLKDIKTPLLLWHIRTKRY